MASKNGTFWFWSDWLGDQAVRRLTLAERGLWIDLIAFAAVSNPKGYVCDDMGRPLTHEEIARVTNAASPVEVAELISGILTKGAASRDRAGRLFNRRMVREAELSAKRSRAGKKGALHTNLITKQFTRLSRQVTQQVPRQTSPPLPAPLPKKNKKTSRSLLGHQETNEEALPDESEKPSSDKRVCDESRADLEKIYAAKHNKSNE